jgi:hypothetical protein
MRIKATIAKLNDTCGNLIQITQLARWKGGRVAGWLPGEERLSKRGGE